MHSKRSSRRCPRRHASRHRSTRETADASFDQPVTCGRGALTMSIFCLRRSLLLFVAALATSTAVHAQSGDAGMVPAQVRNSPIAGQYIVLLRPEVPDAAAEARALASQVGGAVQRVYSHALKGFSATLPEAAASQLRNRPSVLLVEQDRVVSLDLLDLTEQTNAT